MTKQVMLVAVGPTLLPALISGASVKDEQVFAMTGAFPAKPVRGGTETELFPINYQRTSRELRGQHEIAGN
jgi:hypothetical protein